MKELPDRGGTTGYERRFADEDTSERHWRRLGILPFTIEPGGTAQAPDEALAEQRGREFCERFSADLARLKGALSRDSKRRLVRRILRELERAGLIPPWVSEHLQTHGIRARALRRPPSRGSRSACLTSAAQDGAGQPNSRKAR